MNFLRHEKAQSIDAQIVGYSLKRTTFAPVVK
jgi:hypothetical protein